MFSSHLVAFRSLKKGRLVSSGYYLNYSCPLSIQYIYRIHLQNSVESAFGRSSSWGERVLLCSSTCSSCCVCSPRHKPFVLTSQTSPVGQGWKNQPWPVPCKSLHLRTKCLIQMFFIFQICTVKCVPFYQKKQVPKSKQKKILLEDPGINGYLIFAYTVVQQWCQILCLYISMFMWPLYCLHSWVSLVLLSPLREQNRDWTSFGLQRSIC